MKIQTLIEQTMNDIQTYRYPSTSEFRNYINPILKAAGVGELLDSDRIESLDIDSDELAINFSYSRMQCECSSDYRIPVSILNANDPVAAANLWRLDGKINAAKEALEKAEKDLAYRSTELQKAYDEKIIWTFKKD